MVLEVAILDVKTGQNATFEAAFQQAAPLIASIPGYVSHELQHCLENSQRYILLVQWQTLEAHTVGFRQSAQYQEWKRLLHHFYDPFPTVEHYVAVMPRATVVSAGE
jgi:heme-degrading monooxygenase HmoA